MTIDPHQQTQATDFIDQIQSISRKYGLGECGPDQRSQAVSEVAEALQRLTPDCH